MKNFVSKRMLSSVVAGVVIASSTIAAINAAAAQTLQTTPNDTRKEGWYNNYHHEIWQADTPNSSTMTLHDNDGGFSTSWKCGPNNSGGNFLARRGLFWDKDNPKTWKDYNDFYCDFDCNWSAGSSGNSRICIYGWSQNPLVEYYIIEDWKNWSPAQDSSANYKGSVTIDGSEYKVYTINRNSYTIEGNKDFVQYISIRQNTRTSGTISVSEHFKAWERMGMKMGNLYEVAFNVEGWESDGQADVSLTLREGKSGSSGNSGNSDNSGSHTPMEGTLYTGTFENGTDYWESRGSANITSSSSKAAAGSKSLYISGRQNNWNGAELALDSNYFKAGQAYSFSTQVMPATSTTVQLSMQYDQNGSTKYTQVASANASAGKWTLLENSNFTIPSGASNVKLYVEAPDSLTDMYIDQAICASAGYKASTGSQQQGGNNNVDTNKKLVAISFDDGTGVAGQRITDALAANGFHATFFYVGNWINNENQVRYAYNKGMEIANHTTSHQDLTGMSAQQIRKEYDDTQYKLRNIIGTEPSKLMRLPYLSCNWQVQQTLNDVPLISCSVDSEDWKGISSDQIVANIQNAARNGSLEGAIVLCHENQANTATAMETVLPWLKDNGYEVVTISDMFAAKGQTLQGGQVYTKVS
ncbi:MAG: glycoside hydrolase family 11 protein [Ruminococcus sp.]|nr:glycoside hydrolase family 11 protein [Ruminococcus sp.]